MKGIYTRVSSIEEADDLGHFIMRLGYEGVQNDSYRYCKLQMKIAIERNARHHNPHCFVGVNGGRLVVGANRKAMRRQLSMKYIEKERVFRNLLTRC